MRLTCCYLTSCLFFPGHISCRVDALQRSQGTLQTQIQSDDRYGRAESRDVRFIRPGDEFRQSYHANEVVPLIKHDSDAYGRSRTQIFGRRGEECQLRDRGRPARPIEKIRGNALEHYDFVVKVQVRRPPLSNTSVSALGAFPEPSAVVVGEECRKTAIAEYEGANAPKIFYE